MSGREIFPRWTPPLHGCSCIVLLAVLWVRVLSRHCRANVAPSDVKAQWNEFKLHPGAASLAVRDRRRGTFCPPGILPERVDSKDLRVWHTVRLNLESGLHHGTDR